jgi:hypothetical protein
MPDVCWGACDEVEPTAANADNICWPPVTNFSADRYITGGFHHVIERMHTNFHCFRCVNGEYMDFSEGEEGIVPIQDPDEKCNVLCMDDPDFPELADSFRNGGMGGCCTTAGLQGGFPGNPPSWPTSDDQYYVHEGIFYDRNFHIDEPKIN